jgi:hypothetical protein
LRCTRSLAALNMDFVDKAAFKNGRDNLFLEVGGTGSVFRFDSEILHFISRGLPERRGPRPFPLNVRRGRLASLLEVNGIHGAKFQILQIM